MTNIKIMYFIKSSVKWYKRTGGTFAKQVNVFADCEFEKDEPVHVIRSQDFEKYFNPELVKENERLKETIKQMQNQIDELSNKSADDEIADKIILSEFKNQMQNQIDKNDELQKKIDDLNDDLKDEKDKMINVQTFSNMLMQEINKKNLELNDYQNDVETCTSDLADAVKEYVCTEYKEMSFFKKLRNAKPDDLNDGLDDIIKQHTPTRTKGFLQIPINVDDYDVKDNPTSDKTNSD